MPGPGQECANAAPSLLNAISDRDASTRPAKRLRPPSGQPICDSPFYLMSVPGLSHSANEGFPNVFLHGLVCGKIKWCLCGTMSLDVPWLLNTCPGLLTAKELVFVTDEKRGHRSVGHSCSKCRQVEAREALRRLFNEEEGAGAGESQPRWLVHVPPNLYGKHGKHHSKWMLLEHDIGLRFIVLTGNFQPDQFNNVMQAVWFQDFPLKQQSSCGSGSQDCSPFETRLSQYLRALDLPEPQADHVKDLLRRHDFSAARAELVASVPGEHVDAAFGYRRLAALLWNGGSYPERFAGSPLVAQATTIGDVTAAGWLEREFIPSLSAGYVSAAPAGEAGTAASSSGQRLLGIGRLWLVWPTEEEVDKSLAGRRYANNHLRMDETAFHDIERSPQRIVLRSWGGEPAGRELALPHTKIYCRYAGEKDVAWVCLGSHNLSKEAWGAVQPSDGKLKILNYELSVLLTPARELAYQRSSSRGFSCTSGHPPLGPLPGLGPTISVRFTAWQQGGAQAPSLLQANSSGSSSGSSGGGGDGGTLVVPLPLPFTLKGSPLVGDDHPWKRSSRSTDD